MRSLILIAVVITLTTARPELYKEKEDFQYSRSSSDEGTKSGYYDAQRGNMGGNYERAHNMDKLAQHQMSGLVRQVEGELGDGSRTRTGSVFSAANSRGIYGSGNFDLSNLQGRNFQESASFDDNQSQTSAYREHLSNSNRYSNSYRHGSSQQLRQDMQSSHTENAHNAYERHESDVHGHSSGYSRNLESSNKAHEQRESDAYSHSSDFSNSHLENANNAYEQSESDAYGHSSGYRYYPRNRLINTTPMKIMIRPGTKVILPVASETYDAGHSASSYHNSDSRSEAEVLTNGNEQTNHRYPNNNKHYESSYSYHKEWEKHNSNPESVTDFPTESQRLQAAQRSDDEYYASGSNSHNSNAYKYGSNVESAKSSESRHQSDYNSQYQQSSSSNSKANAYTHSGANSVVDADLLRKLDTNSRPKSYQSSYSYHKSWERQGDPYVIIPTSNSGTSAQTSQRLSAASNPHGSYSSHQYGSHYKQAHQSYTSGSTMDCDCDEDEHSRVARSYNSNPEEFNAYQRQQNDDEDQKQQYQSQWNELQNLGQQTQNNWKHMEDFGQQSQNIWDHTENLGLQSQNRWDKIEDLGQQTQNKWENIEELGQQAQSKWDKIEDVGQQSQNSWDKLEDLGQQTQNQWGKTDSQFSQGYQFDNFEQREQYHQSNVDQQQDIWGMLENAGQHKQKDTDNFGQQIQNQWHNIGKSENENQNKDNIEIRNKSKNNHEQFPADISESNLSQHEENNKHSSHISIWDKLNNFESFYNVNKIPEKAASNTEEGNIQSFEKDTYIKPVWELVQDNSYKVSKNYDLDNSSENNAINNSSLNQDTSHTVNFWNKLETLSPKENNNNKSKSAINSQLVRNDDKKERSNTSSNINTSTTMKTNHDIVIEHKDVGRGDIASEDLIVKETSENIENNNHKKYYEDKQYPEEIETLSEFNELRSNKTKNNFTQNIYVENDSDSNETLNNSNNVILEGGPVQVENLQTNNNKKLVHTNIEKKIVDLKNENEEFNHKNNGEKDKNFAQNTFVNQIKYTEGEKKDTNKQNTDHQSDIALQNENQHSNKLFNIQQSQDLNEENGKSNMEQISTFDQNHDINDVNNGQKFDFGQQSDNFNQQNMEQVPDFSQQNEQNIEQQFDFGQHSENFHQQNVEQFDIGQQNENYQENMNLFSNFGQHNENLNEQNNAQQFDFGQQSENFNQKNMEQLPDFSQQNVEQFDFGQQNIEQQFDIGQQNVEQQFDIGQQNVEQFDIGKQKEHSNQQNIETLSSFGQQSEQNMAQIFDFEHQNEKLNQQHVEQFHVGQQSENFNQPINGYVVKDDQFFNQQGRNSDYSQRDKSQETIKQDEKPAQSSEINNPKYYSLDTFIKQDIEKQTLTENQANKITSTVLPITEKPGFWASVGNKFTGAKDKVVSWFKRS